MQCVSTIDPVARERDPAYAARRRARWWSLLLVAGAMAGYGGSSLGDFPGSSFSVSLGDTGPVVKTLLAVGGNGAASLPDKSLQLIAKAADRNGNGISGVRVTWASGPGGSVAASGDTTDVNGLARATFTVGKDPGRYTATASAASLGSVTFAVDAIATSSAVLASSIDRQLSDPNAQLGPRAFAVPGLP